MKIKSLAASLWLILALLVYTDYSTPLAIVIERPVYRQSAISLTGTSVSFGRGWRISCLRVDVSEMTVDPNPECRVPDSLLKGVPVGTR